MTSRRDIPFSLPKNVHPSHGALHYVTSRTVEGKRTRAWHYLCRITEGEAALYAALAKLKAQAATDFTRHLAEFRIIHCAARTATTRRDADRMIDNIGRAFIAFNVADILPSDVQDFVTQFGTAWASARAHKALLSKFLTWCVLVKRLRTDNPASLVRIERGERKPIVWTPQVYHQVRDALGATDEADMIRCYMDLSYLLAQRGTDVRLLARRQIQGNVIVSRPAKTRKSTGIEVEIPITAAIRATLDRAAALSRKWGVVSAWVIHTRAGSSYTRSGIHSAFRRAGERVGITGADPKSLRNFAATMAKRAGYSIEQLRDTLAHVDISTTQGYLQRGARVQSQVIMELPERGER